ncbi:MAG: hypothetical protein ACKVS8_02345 [Phycisphaerales bacterium]
MSAPPKAPMAQAYLNSIEALSAAKAAVATFIEECSRAIMESDADAVRQLDRLSHDDAKRWQREERVRSDAVQAAKALILKKELTAMHDNPSVVDERKAVSRAQGRLAEAGDKRAAVRRWSATLDKELATYKGQVQGLSECLARTLPMAMQSLDRMASAVQAYAAISTPPSQEPPSPAAAAQAGPGARPGSAPPTEPRP